MSSTSARPAEVNAAGPVGPPSSSAASAEMSSPQQPQAATPTLNNLLRGDSVAAAMYMQQQQGPQLQVPSHMQHMMGPPQATFHSPQPSPIPNGSYSNPGSAAPPGGKGKSKSGSRPASRDVIFSNSAGQGGPPPQMPSMQNPAVYGLRMEGPSVSPGSPAQGYPSQESVQHGAAVAQQQMQQSSQQAVGNTMQQQAPGYPPGLYPPGYWPPQQPRYGMQTGATPPGHYYHHPGQQQVPQSAFSGYPMHSGRPMMPATKVTPVPQIEMPRMPNGPTAIDWQSKMVAPKVPQQEGSSMMVPQSMGQPLGPTPSVAAPSPGGASSAADESLDDSKSLRGGSPASWPHTPAQLSQGQRTPVPPGQPATPGVASSGKVRESSSSIVDKLVGPVTVNNPQQVMRERRMFFEKLVQFCESQGEPITQVPQVSKQTVDLHRLYIAVLNRGGFEQVTREKTWKQICTEANSEMSESSAAGYQLRRHYQKYLLGLECFETGKNASEAVAFAEKLKKKKRTEKETPPQHYPAPGPPGQPAAAHPGYGAPHPGDPNSGYYYGHQMDPSSMQARPQAPPGWQPQSYPPGPGVGGAPPVYPAGMRSAAPMRAPLPQQMLPGPPMDEQQRYEEQQRHHYFQQQQQQQQAAYAAQHQQISSAASSSSLQVDASGSQSRAPSTGPPAGGATPDSSSRLSAEETMPHRPPSHSQVPTATPPTGPPPAPQQAPAQGPVSYYGQAQAPQMYGAPGLRPSAPPASSLPIKSSGGYPSAYSQPQPSGYPSVHSYPEGYQTGHPAMPPQQQHAMYQQQIWASQQAQRYPAAHASIPTSSSAPAPSMGTGVPPRVTVPTADLGVAQQAYAVARRPPYYHIQGQATGTPHAGAPSPGAPPATRLRGAVRPLPIGAPMGYPHTAPSTSTGIGGMHTTAAAMQSTSAVGATGHGTSGSGIGAVAPSVISAQYPPVQPMQFPAGSVEATTISQRRRRKLLCKDLIRADARRLAMALRSGLDTETTWALNALNVLLYDDMAVPLNLNQTPALLNVIVEHFRAQLNLLFPDVFSVDGESKVRTVEDDNDFWGVASKGEKTPVRPLVAQRSSKTEPTNFTRISRTGRTVHIEKKNQPDSLRRMRPDGWTMDLPDRTLTPEYYLLRVPRGLGCGTSSYLVTRLEDDIEMKKQVKGGKFSLHEMLPCSSSNTQRSEQNRVNGIDIKKGTENVAVEMKALRPTALCIRDESRIQVVRRCLSICNILRGFSFLPGNEGPMSRHPGLLMIVGRLLRLHADEQPITRPRALNVKQELNKEEVPRVPAVGSLSEATKRLLAPGELLEEDDDAYLMLQETANQLREDTFVILSHLSVQLDLLEFDSEISWPIFDGLIHWCVSKCAEANDPLPPCMISPRNFALETLCKMSVIDRNVDLLVSTGPWSRIERFIKLLASLLTLNEEAQYREFAIVILNAMCAASEAVCVVTASDSPAIHHLVAFLEMGDSSMHQVVQTHGMQALRENPELMGTSVGMLRRAASLLQHLCKVPACRKHFIKHQQRLLQFTMSQLMDSRVGAIIADTLYEVQKGITEEREKKEALSEEELKQTKGATLVSPLKKEPASEESTNETAEEWKPEATRKRERDENGVSKAVSGDPEEADGEAKDVKDSSPPPVKKQRLENGTLNHVHRNGGGSTPKPLVNGDASPPPMKSMNPMPPRKGVVAAVENGANANAAGSVQAVA